MKFQPHERVFYNIFAPGIFGEMGLHPTKLEEMARSAVIKKTRLPSHPNSVFFPSNNEKRKIYVQRNLLKRERYKPEHQAPKHHVKVVMIDLHRNTAAYIPVNRGSSNAPPQRIPQGSGEVLERDRGSKSPVSLQPPPRGAN